MNARRTATAVVLALGVLGQLAGCASSLPARVTTFHRLPATAQAMAGQTFRIMATAEQQASLEFAAYADHVRRALVAQGLVDAGSSAAALSVTVRYAVTETAPTQVAPTSQGGLSIGTGFGRGVSFGFGLGFPIGATQTVERARERVDLWVTIDRREAAGAEARVYEGHAVSDDAGRADMPQAVPALVRALFSDFPGANGQTREVAVPRE